MTGAVRAYLREAHGRDVSREATRARIRAACGEYAADLQIDAHVERITETVMSARAAARLPQDSGEGNPMLAERAI